MMVKIIRIAISFVISFMAYRFLNVLFDLVKSYLKKPVQPVQTMQEEDKNNNKREKIIDTQFVEDSSDNKNNKNSKDN